MAKIAQQDSTKLAESVGQANLILSITGWTLGLLLGPYLIFSFLTSLIIAINGLGEFASENPQVQILVSVWTTLLSPLVFIPLVQYLSKTHGLILFAIRPRSINLNFSNTVIIIVFTLFIELTFSAVYSVLNIPLEKFSSEVAHFISTPEKLILIFLAVCMFAPVMEEIVFRGWLFQKVADTWIGDWGALIVTSLLFAVIHVQYEHASSTLMLFIYGLIVGLFRLKTGSIHWSVVIHVSSNIFILSSLLIFPYSGFGTI